MNTNQPNAVDPGEPQTGAAAEVPMAGPTQLVAPIQQRNLPDSGQRRRLRWRMAGLLLLGLISIPIWRAVRGRADGMRPTIAEASRGRLPTVPVARVVREDLYNEVPMAAEFRPYEEVDLHAKVSGYVKEMNVDFGDRVKGGQLLATLEVPELHDELNRAIAAHQRAVADYTNAHLIYTRLLAVDTEHPNLVAQQELDTAQSKDLTTEAAIAAAKAEVERYQTLLTYTRITAPFDGVVTHRFVDRGALIQAGTTSQTQSLPLVRVSDNYRLRLDFPVSVAHVKEVRVGDTVEVRVESLGAKRFAGIITRATLRVNEDTRTMITEIEVANPNLELVPGMYAEVRLKVQRRLQALAVPIEAVPPGQTSSLYIINDQDQIEERPVSLGIDTPNRYEVTTGLKGGELVLVGSRSQVRPGDKVKPILIGSTAPP